MRRAADLACFSAKYFWGPNGGGFVAGRRAAVARLAALDFTGYESGRVADVRAGVEARPRDGRGDASPRSRRGWRSITRARWAGYAALARALAERLRALPGAACELRAVHAGRALVDGRR